MTQQYWVPAVIIGTLSLSLFFLVREPTIKEHIKLEDGSRLDSPVNRDQTWWAQFKDLSS